MANPKNKWDQPSAPPAPMFFGKKERDLVKQVNDELSERIIGQPIAYYPISIEDSNFNDTYGEAIEKVSLPPVRLYAYVVVENEQSNERYGYEYQTKLTVNFSRRRLVEDQDLFVRVGDFVQYGDYFYEIVKTYNDTRYYFGQVEHKFQISAECIRARSGNFRVIPAVTRPTDTVTPGGAAGTPAPRAAPYPPLTATYITVTAASKLPNERILTAGSGITITDAGAGGALTLTATGQNAIGPTGSLQLTTGAGGFSGSANLLFLTSSDTIALTGAVEVVGTMSASSTISAKTLSASLMNLQPTSGSLAGGASYLGLNTSNNLILTAAATTATSPGGATTQIQYNNAGAFGGSSNLTFNGTTLTGSYTGSLAEFITLSASLMNLVPTSGSLGGGSSYLGLDVSNNLILTSAATTATSPGGSTTEVQYNSGGSFAASSNLTFNGTTLTGSFTGSLAEYTALTASALQAQNLEVSGGNVTILSSHSTPGTANPTDGRLLFDKIFDNSGAHTANKIVLYDDGGVGASWKAGIGVSSNSVDFYSGDKFNFWTDHGSAQQGDNRFTILTNGNVGIGTDAPNYPLEVAGTVGIDDYIYHNGDGDTYLKFATDEVNLVAGGKSVIKLDESGTNDRIKINNTNADIDLWVLADDGEVILATDAENNRVGINTDEPTYALDVAGDAGFNEYIYHNGDTNTFFRFTNDRIYIEAGGQNMLYLVSGSGGAQDAKATINNDGVDVDFQVKGLAEANLIRTDALNDMVGIGHSSSVALLHVSSSGDAALFRVDGATAGNVLFVTGSGRVGIGTTTPTHPLTVVGASYLSGALVHKRTAVTNDYSVALTDYYLGVDSTSNTVDLTLPAASTAVEGQTYVVKDEGGNAATNAITVLRSASDTIDGNTSVALAVPYSALSLYTDGANWFIY